MESQVDMQVFRRGTVWILGEHVIKREHSKCNRLTEQENSRHKESLRRARLFTRIAMKGRSKGGVTKPFLRKEEVFPAYDHLPPSPFYRLDPPIPLWRVALQVVTGQKARALCSPIR